MEDYLQRAVSRGHAELLINNADALLRYQAYSGDFSVVASPIRWAVLRDGTELLSLVARPTSEGVNIVPQHFTPGPWEEEFVRWVFAALADAAIWRLRRKLIDESATELMEESMLAAEQAFDDRSDDEVLQDELDHHAAQRADLP